MRVLFADTLDDRARTRLAAAGFEVRLQPKASGETLREAIEADQPDVLVVRSTKVQAEHLSAYAGLQLVVRAGAGVNSIDLASASGRAVFVANCPGKNAVAVAELAMGLILSLDRHLPASSAALKAGQWNKKEFSVASGLHGSTLAVVGLGQIGQELVQRAKAFGMNVVAWSRSLTPERAAELGVEFAATPEEAVRSADVVSVHLALKPETTGMIGASIFQSMRHGAHFINTSRAEVVDEAALLEALETRGLRAALDVFSDEPSSKQCAFEHPLAKHPSVIGTHHTGASTQQAQEAVAAEVCRIIEDYAATGRVMNCVNRLVVSTATHRVIVRHFDRVGVLARVLERLGAYEHNVQEMENLVFGSGAAIARIQVASEPSQALMDELSGLADVIHATSLPIEG